MRFVCLFSDNSFHTMPFKISFSTMVLNLWPQHIKQGVAGHWTKKSPFWTWKFRKKSLRFKVKAFFVVFNGNLWKRSLRFKVKTLFRSSMEIRRKKFSDLW